MFHSFALASILVPGMHNMAQEQTRIILLQEQNEDLHHSLLQTAVRMECLGEEFMTSHQVLEAELQKTRVELSHLTDKFKRLQDNYSSTQQTNNLLEHKLQSVAQHMEGERERLNHRITALTDQLATAAPDPRLEMLHVTSSLHTNLERHFRPDDPTNQFVLPVAPPPPQFVDSQNYGKPKGPNQNQSLVSVPEEEESDWSEMGDETPRFLLTGSNRFQAASAGFLPWRSEERRGGGWPGQGDGDGDSESGGEEFVRHHPPGSLHLPHLHFTLHHHEMFPPPPDDGCPAAYRIMTDGQGASGEHGSSPVRLRSSPICRRSISLEEIAGACHHMQQQERRRRS
ncbi:Tight junction-associated protein 1 [Merluccius polli]|uniref:Tight junction-associated protein 1 n=1 Tax=Merluccius polli TaxID=89951 RepID=A0AA47MP36_MERPO|nr:Tight junction-associated protein 1 [Merluccius polli]